MLTHRHGLTVWLLISFVALLFAQISFSPFAFAADRFVGTMPGDYPSIKDALDAAADGDRVILRQGTYSEDVIIDKPGIQLVPEMGAAVTLDGNITLTSAAGGSDISGIEMSDGKSIVVEDGISWPVSLPLGTESRVVMIASGSDGFDITLGDVTANAGFDSVMGAYIFTGEHSEVRHEGEIVVESSADSSSARGASIVMGANAEATFDRVEAQAGRVAIGVHFFTSNDGELTVTGDVVAHTRDFDSSATGVGVRGQTNVSAALGDIDVEGGSRAVGIDFNVTDNGILTHSGDVVVSARDAASAAYGVTLGAGDGFLATIENVAVDAGLLARGVTTTYDTIVGTEGIANDADIHIVGGVFVTARDVDSEAYGVDLEGEGNVSLSVRDVAVEGGRLARGIWLQTAGDGGNLSHVGDVSTTARDSGSQAYGVDVAVGNNFASTVGSVQVSAPGLARAVYFTGGHNGSLVIEGDLSATSSAGATHGMLVDAGDQFQASVRNVQVEGGGNTIQGVALNVGSGGSLSQEGLIEVKGTSASSNVRGVNVLAQEGFSASIDNVAVEGLRSALGVYWSSTDGASLIHTGAISATATDASASAAGASIVAGHDFTMTLGDIVVAGNGDGSQGYGAHVTAGDGFTGHGGDVSVTGHSFAVGLDLFVSAAADVEFGVFDVASKGADSSASGINFSGGKDARLTLSDMSVSAASRATGLFFEHRSAASGEVLDNLSVTHEGVISVEGLQADSLALGVFGAVGDDFTGVFGDVLATGKAATWGVSLEAGDRAVLDVDSVQTVSEDVNSQTYGVRFTGNDDVSVTMGDVVSRAERAAWAVTVTGNERLTLDVDTVTAQAGTQAYGVVVNGESSAVTLRGNVSAMAVGGDTARALIVGTSVADVTNHGHVHATADNAIGIGFGQSAAGRRIELHNYGVVETSANSGSAVAVNVVEEAIVQNEGTIDAGDRIALHGSLSTGSIILSNAGEIFGDVLTGHGADLVSVAETGRIVGNVNLGDGTDQVALQRNAAVEGNLNMGAGDDSAIIHYGAVLTGLLDGGAGDDVLTLSGDGASLLSPGATWNRLSARGFEQTWVHGGLWQWDAATSLGAVDVYDAFVRIDDDVSIANLQLKQGALFGNGSVAGNVVNVGGVVSPGNSYGILTITGNYTQGPDGVLEIELDATTAPNPGVNYDQLVIVGGTAVFEDGTTVRVRPTFGPTSPDRAEYVLVHGDVVFDVDTINLDLELPLFYGGWLEEGSMKLFLGIIDFDAVAETENQKAVAQALTEAKESPQTDLGDLYDWLVGLDPDQSEDAIDAYDSLAGEVYSHLPDLASRRLDNVASSIGRGITHSTVEPLRRVWAVSYLDSGRVAAGTGTAESRFHLSGVLAGMDFLTGPSSRIGFGVGGGSDRLTMDDRASEVWGSGHHVGLYGRFALGATSVTTLLTYGRTTYRSERDVVIGDLQRRAEADFATTDWIASVESRFPLSSSEGIKIEPVVSLGRYSADYRSFAEQGVEPLGLIVDGRVMSWWRGRVALEATGRPWSFGSGMVRPRVSLAWVNDFSPVERIHTGRLQGAPDNPFTIRGTNADRSGYEATLGFKSEGGGNTMWSLDYTGQFRSDISSHVVTARIVFEF